MFVIYALVDPIEEYKVHYVGMSSNVTERYIQHLRCTDTHPAKNEWIRNLNARGYIPTLRTLEVVETERQAQEREAYWIHFYTKLHMPLFNSLLPSVRTQRTDGQVQERQQAPPPRKSQQDRSIRIRIPLDGNDKERLEIAYQTMLTNRIEISASQFATIAHVRKATAIDWLKNKQQERMEA